MRQPAAANNSQSATFTSLLAPVTEQRQWFNNELGLIANTIQA